MSKDWYKDIREFQEKVCGDETPSKPFIPGFVKQSLRKELILEEITETLDAIEDEDLIKITDGIVDSIVVLLGTAVTYGIDIRPIWDEIHKTNMAKRDGPIREDGKRLKPEGWQPPDIKSLLIQQGWE